MNLSMSLVLVQIQRLDQRLEQRLSMSFGETSGDIPVYSLHRITHLLRSKPMAISPAMAILFAKHMVRANKVYREVSGNKWNCLTSNNLFDLLTGLEQEIAEINNAAVESLPAEVSHLKPTAIKHFSDARSHSLSVVKEWFEESYNEIQYDMDAKIPWPIVQRLRVRLGAWIIGATNPFQEPIDEMILEVAQSEGITSDSAEDAWVAMGGTFFKKKKKSGKK